MKNQKMRDFPKYGEPFESNEFYHVYNHAVGNEWLFISEENFHFFLSRYKKYMNGVLSTYAYCLLRNHFHFLIKVNKNVSSKHISDQFRKFFISYAKAFNIDQNRRGSFFEKHLKRVRIKSDEQLAWIIYYIHRNPIHHQLKIGMKNYKWSSYKVLLSNKESEIQREEVLKFFSGRQNLIKFHRMNISLDILSEKIDLIDN
jgi:hypothetical protein